MIKSYKAESSTNKISKDKTRKIINYTKGSKKLQLK